MNKTKYLVILLLATLVVTAIAALSISPVQASHSPSSIVASDSTGTAKHAFSTTDDLWVHITQTGSGSGPSVRLYVVSSNPSDGATLTDVSGGIETVSLPNNDVSNQRVWVNPTTPGTFWVILDRNTNGVFNSGTDLKDLSSITIYQPVTMTVSYSFGSGSPAAPIFHYIDNYGSSQTYTLTTTAHSIATIAAGTIWSVTPNPLMGSTSTEQWYSADTLTGNAPASGSQTKSFSFVHQFKHTITSSTTGTGYIAVDSVAQSTPYTTNWWNSGSSHTIAASSSVTLVSGQSQNIYLSWSDSGAQSHSIAPTAAATYTANYQTQYNVHYVASGNLAPVTVPSDQWINSGSAATGSFPTLVTNAGVDTKSNFATDNRPITITAPTTVTGTYTNQFKVHYAAAGNVLAVAVPSDEWVTSGNSAIGSFTASVTNGASDTRCNFVSDNRPAYITTVTTVTGTYQSQYLVAFNVNPASTGSTTPATDTWYNVGATASISASANSGYNFQTWSSTGTINFLDNTAASTSATISSPGAITANFEIQVQATSLTVSSSPEKVDKSASMQATIQGKLLAGSLGVGGKEITLQFNDGSGWQDIATATTQPDGSYTYTWTVPTSLANGFHVVKADFTGDNQPYQSSTAATTNNQGGGGLFVVSEYAFGALAALGASFAGLVVVKKRSSKKI